MHKVSDQAHVAAIYEPVVCIICNRISLIHLPGRVYITEISRTAWEPWWDGSRLVEKRFVYVHLLQAHQRSNFSKHFKTNHRRSHFRQSETEHEEDS